MSISGNDPLEKRIKALQSIPVPDLESIEHRNTERKALKQKAAEGPWYVKQNTYRGIGTKYQVRQRLEDYPDAEAIIVPDSDDPATKAFIAHTRSDSPETDIDDLVLQVRTLLGYRPILTELDHRLQLLEAQCAALQQRLSQAEHEKHQAEENLAAFKRQTEDIYISAALIRQGLEFYADESNWQWKLAYNRILKDNGELARQTLQSCQAGQELLEQLRLHLQNNALDRID